MEQSHKLQIENCKLKIAKKPVRNFQFSIFNFQFSIFGFALAMIASAADSDKQAIRASTVTIQQKSIPISAALKELKKQTGNEVEDRRAQYGQPTPDMQLDVSLDNVPFWQALDAICRQAKLQVFPLEAENRIGLIARRSTEQPPVQYAGPFRVSLKRVEAKPATVTLQIHWEPRYYPFFLKIAADSFLYAGADGQLKPAPQTSVGTVPLLGQQGRELQVRLPSGNQTIKELKGKFTAHVAAGLADFQFKSITQASQQRHKDFTVSLKEFETDGNLWKVGLILEYPASLDLESHQGFVTDKNEIYLERNGSRYKSRSHLMSIAEGGPIGITYEFANLPGKPEDYRLHYRAPASPVPYTIEFALKDLPTP